MGGTRQRKQWKVNQSKHSKTTYITRLPKMRDTIFSIFSSSVRKRSHGLATTTFLIVLSRTHFSPRGCLKEACDFIQFSGMLMERNLYLKVLIENSTHLQRTQALGLKHYYPHPICICFSYPVPCSVFIYLMRGRQEMLSP